MKNDLDLVIAALEAERKSLQKMIKQSTSEHDNLIAYYHSETLLELNHHLGVLYSFRDPLHNQRENLIRFDLFLRKKPKGMEKKLWKFFVERRSRELEKYKSELEEQQKKRATFNDTQEIDDLLFAIAEGRLDEFKVIVSSHDDAEILFIREADVLLISISSHEPYEADFALNNRLPDPLKGLGFEFDADRQAFIHKYDLTNFKDAGDIKILLSRLFFDVFHVSGVKQSIVLKYHEK